jgi:predicted Zn-dependent protease
VWGLAAQPAAQPRPSRVQRAPTTAALILLFLFFSASPGCAPSDPSDDAEALIQSDRPEQAIELLHATLADRPDDAELNRLLGLALIRSGQASLAIWPLRRATEDPASDLETHLLLARALQRGGDTVAAIETATQILERDPSNIAALSIRAESRLSSLQEEEAIEDLETILDLEPTRAYALQSLFEAHHKLEDFHGAMEVLDRYEQALAEQESAIPAARKAEVCARRVGLLRRLGEGDAARAQLERCLADHPTQLTVLAAALALLDAEGEREKATRLLQQAAESRPEDLPLQLSLSRRLSNLDRPQEAEALLLATAERMGEPSVWTALADFRVEAGDTQGAVQALDRAVEAQVGSRPGAPGFSYAEVDDRQLFAHGDLLLEIAEVARTREILEAIEEPVYRRLLEARIHLVEGEPERALAVYEESFLLWHSNPGARYLAASAALKLDRVEDAIRHLREAVRADAAATDAGLMLARIHISQGDSPAAAAALDLHVNAHPDDTRAIRVLARLFSSAGLHDDARAIRDRWSEMPGQAAAAQADRAREIEASEGVDAALAFLEREYADTLDEPGNGAALMTWARLMTEAGRASEAEGRVRRALGVDSESADLQALLGEILLARGARAEAATVLDRALALDPSHPAATRDRCLLRVLEAVEEQARKLCEPMKSLGPEDVDARIEVADAMAQQGLARLAIDHLESLIDDSPWLGSAALRIARIQLSTGDVSDATLSHAERALRFPHGRRPEILRTLGRVQLALGSEADAIPQLLQSTRLDRDDPLAWYYLAEALLAVHRSDEALEAYQKALAAGRFPLEERARARVEALRRAHAGSS